MSRSNEADDPRRRILIQALTAGAFGGGWTADALADIFGTPPSKLPPGQSIYRLSGSVTVNDQPATLKTRIGPSDTIVTGRRSEIVFVSGVNSYIVRDNSRLQMQGRQEGGSVITSALRLLTGRLLAVMGKAPNGLRIQSTTATIGIRGTGVYLEADPEQTYFCTCYGTADIESARDPSSKETVVATHHDKPLYILADPKAAGRNIRQAPFINHTDQELMLIETLVGRAPPFVFPGDDYDAPRREY
jgi:hypothetical protein